MKTTIIIALGALTFATACAVSEQTRPQARPASFMFICDREAQEFDKYGTVEDECAAPAPFVLQAMPEQLPTWVRDRDTRTPTPVTPGNPPVVVVDTDPEPETPVTPERPRGPQGNNGWGNGDQDAPGRSGPRNNAENNSSGKSDPTAR